MKSLLIARNEFETARVLGYLSEETKINRLTALYTDDNIKEVLGYYDESNEDIKHLYKMEEDSKEFLTALYKAAIINGNFEEAIARNMYLPN